MPRERVELIRESGVRNREKMFLLAYEGNETEPTYFEALKEDYRFNHEIIEIVSLRRDPKDTRSAPKYVFKNLEAIKEEYDLDRRDELWMIIDRDRNRNNIEKYYQLCQTQNNFFLALSNPCFELWLLLHLKDLKEFTEEELLEIETNKKINRTRTYIKKLLSTLLAD